MLAAVLRTGRFFATHPLTKDAPGKAWFRFLSWQVRSRLRREIAFEWIAGQKLSVRKGMTGATGNIYVGLHEFSGMALPLHFLRPGDVFLDVGANIGSFSILASGVAGATTWAFEPDPGSARSLRRNVEINGLEGLVTVVEAAVGERDGTIAFTTGLDTTNQVTTTDDKTAQIVRIVSLDSCAEDLAPAMMKIDVEGHEDAVIRGASRLLAGSSLKIIELEGYSDECVATLERHGFAIAYYDALARRFSTTDLGDKSNAIWIRDMPFVMDRISTAPRFEVVGKSV